jgi:Flp pilus assembly protein TadD
MTKWQTKGARFGLAALGAGMFLALTPTAAQAGQDNSGDALSRNLRTLAANPKSLSALMGAGKAALELGDAQAAITFFGRAEHQAPRDGRVKMWIGSALVHLQQPQAAIRFFDEAVTLGVAEAEVAGERGLAYDISGDPRRAQRDYRHALTRGRDAEITRRLALSLAISGEREPALQLLQEQLAMRDKAAERTRAFVLALTGDGAGAARTVQSAMPHGQGAALAPFLERLASLNTADRALAVHLGHFPRGGRSTVSTPPRSYAAVDSALRAGAPDTSRTGLGQRVTPPAATPAQTKREEPLAGVRTATAAERTQLPRFEPRPVQVRARPVQTAEVAPVEQKPAQSVSAQAAEQKPVEIAQPAPVEQKPVQVAAAALQVAQPVPAGIGVTPSPQADSGTQTAMLNAPGFSILPSPATQPPASAAVEESRRVSRLAEVAATLASLSEAAPVEAPAPKPAAPAVKKSAPPAAAAKKEVLAKKGVPAKGAAAAKKEPPAVKKDAPAAKKAATPAEPRRIWVQVAGGADKAALPREFARLKGKAPKLLAARTAWTTPLKATNRLLVGPFKTDKEAQDFVNELRKADLSGFAFTSEAGQKIEKLSAK